MINELISNLHWPAILVGAAAYWVLGAIWYSPILFAKPWSKLVNINMTDPENKKGMPILFIGSFICMLIASIGLGILFKLIFIPDSLHAIKLGLLVSVFFSFSTQSVNYLYTRKPAALYAIDGGYHILGTVLASVIIHLLS